jgi:hypothetical protein
VTRSLSSSQTFTVSTPSSSPPNCSPLQSTSDRSRVSEDACFTGTSLDDTSRESATSSRSVSELVLNYPKSAFPLVRGKHVCRVDGAEFEYDRIDDLIDHVAQYHGFRNKGAYYCSICNLQFFNRKDFRRHLTSTLEHSAGYRCRCRLVYPRKENFRKHAEKDICQHASCFECPCGSTFDSLPDILQHIRSCSERRRGRPRKQ